MDSGERPAALVTGAASGIGRCFAESLSRQGRRVGLLDVSAEGLASVVSALRQSGGVVESRSADVSEANEVAEAVGALVAQLGRVDLVVHCAAILGPGHFASQSAADFERVVRVDLLGTANVLRAALPALRQTRGSMACLASTAAVHGWPALSAYSAAKCGVAGFCDGARQELARDGVGLTSVFPLLIDTPLLSRVQEAPILRGRRLPPQVVVDKTLAAVAKRRSRVFIPSTVRVIALLHGLAPSLLDWYARQFGFSTLES